jgi:hypothetical protein
MRPPSRCCRRASTRPHAYRVCHPSDADNRPASQSRSLRVHLGYFAEITSISVVIFSHRSVLTSRWQQPVNGRSGHVMLPRAGRWRQRDGWTSFERLGEARLIWRMAAGQTRGHAVSPEPSSSSSGRVSILRSTSRARPRVGPMLPTGMPSRSDISAYVAGGSAMTRLGPGWPGSPGLRTSPAHMRMAPCDLTVT